jgi:hypothetical protein
LSKLYNAWAGKRKAEAKKFTNKKFMTVQEFRDLWVYYNIFDDLFVERDISIIYNSSMQYQVKINLILKKKKY